MLQVVLFILSVALATVNGWGSCFTGDVVINSNNPCEGVGSVRPNYVETVNGQCANFNVSASCSGGVGFINECPVCKAYLGSAYVRRTCCSTQCELDSLKCEGTFIRDEQGCRCVNCQPFDTTIVDNGCSYDNTAGKYLNYKITRNCHVDTCGAVNQVTCSADTVSYYSLTCDTTCNENSDITCMGSIDGVNVYLRGCNGRVTKCEADGSCDMAIRKVADGECENPNDPPNPNSSSEAGSSSSEAGSSSGTGEDWEWLKDSLHVIHVTNRDSLGAINHNLENMQPFISGTYDQVTDIAGTVHDINSNFLTSFEYLNDIKENTGNTAQNTNNINSKLTNTNQLLTDLNNKSWNVNVRPEVTVEGDTTIVNVQTDTAHSGAAILDFLKGIFKGADTTNNYNPNDTAGTGVLEKSLLDKIDSALTDTMPVMDGDSVQAMGDRMRGSYRAIMDSIGNSAISDSMERWSEAITDNGVITGNGSDNCPDVLTQTFDINFPIGGTVSIGPLGVYLCRPVAGLGITFWALCRVILRAMVAIFAMIWLYRSVLGIDGGSNEED